MPLQTQQTNKDTTVNICDTFYSRKGMRYVTACMEDSNHDFLSAIDRTYLTHKLHSRQCFIQDFISRSVSRNKGVFPPWPSSFFITLPSSLFPLRPNLHPSSPISPSHSSSFLSPPLEVGTLNPAKGSGGALQDPSGVSGGAPAAEIEFGAF